METSDKIRLLEEMLELKNGTLNESTALKSIPGWDSMAALSLIALCDEKFHKKLSGDKILSFITVKDITDFMG
ncbi:MAG TPA: acyl carrier protein [Clostridiales bacterium]|jgi:acyl carrier protein|nr:acyl carrier protein [Clostridiales bacterium]HQP70496.1 acyl carrier protein [Clostridiales bacterium]